MGKGRISKEEYEYRLAETAKLLVRRRGYLDVERELARRFGVDMRTTRKWIRAVKERWKAEASEEDVEASRADLVAQLDAVITAAWNHVEVVKDKDGNPLLDQNQTLTDGSPNPGYLKPIVRPAARVQHVLHAVSQLRALKGADKPVTKHVQLDADLNVMPDIGVLPDKVADGLRKALSDMAPDGDIRKLAGEWFTDNKDT